MPRRSKVIIRAVALKLALLFLLSCAANSHAQTTQSPVPTPNPPTPVVDTANVIDDNTKQRLNNVLMNLSENKQANVEMGVVTVSTTGGQDIFDYSLAIMRGWGIGLRDKGGLLLVVAVNDRKYFTQVSRHLEGDLPDGLVGQIQRERLVPLLKQQNYSQAIYQTMMTYIATLAQKRGFSVEGIDQRYAYHPSAQSQRGSSTRGSAGGFGRCSPSSGSAPRVRKRWFACWPRVMSTYVSERLALSSIRLVDSAKVAPCTA